MFHLAAKTSSMLSEMNFYFQLLWVHVLTSWAQKLGGGGGVLYGPALLRTS